MDVQVPQEVDASPSKSSSNNSKMAYLVPYDPLEHTNMFSKAGLD